MSRSVVDAKGDGRAWTEGRRARREEGGAGTDARGPRHEPRLKGLVAARLRRSPPARVGRPAAGRTRDADPARGRRDRVALAGGRGLAGPPARPAAVADQVGLVPALARPRPARRPVGAGGAPPAPRDRLGTGPTLGVVGRRRYPDREVYRRPRPPRGYDAAKRTVGRERVALVNAEGDWLA